MDLVNKILMDVSDPLSLNYGKHLTRAEVGEMTLNREATEFVKSYLSALQFQIVGETIYGDYITVSGTISAWESLLATKFYNFAVGDGEAMIVTRAKEYHLPVVLSDQVIEGLLGIVDFGAPPISRHSRRRVNNEQLIVDYNKANEVGHVTPQLIRSFYGIPLNDTGDTRTSQAIYASLDQSFSDADLLKYQQYFNLTIANVTTVIGGHEIKGFCSQQSECGEANLDVQIMMGLSPHTPTTFYYIPTNASFSTWAATVANMTHPPKVFSISYGMPEKGATNIELTSFNNEAQILGVQGVTIFASSGDDGILQGQSKRTRYPGKSWYCSYIPGFPSSSPYVTAVGATMGPESNSPEVVCESTYSRSGITSGGGFSSFYPRPDWQHDEVDAYLSTVSPKPRVGYNSGGRGYPDVAVMGNQFSIFVGGKEIQEDGTSASAPLFASMISLINAARVQSGKSTVGFINPALYYFYRTQQQKIGKIFNDVTSGENNCAAMGQTAASANGATLNINCCEEGFYAGKGWDPASGLGSVYYPNLKSAFLSLGRNVSETMFSKSPSSTPYPTPQPSSNPLPVKQGWSFTTKFAFVPSVDVHIPSCETSDIIEVQASRLNTCITPPGQSFSIQSTCSQTGESFISLYNSSTQCSRDDQILYKLGTGCEWDRGVVVAGSSTTRFSWATQNSCIDTSSSSTTSSQSSIAVLQNKLPASTEWVVIKYYYAPISTCSDNAEGEAHAYKLDVCHTAPFEGGAVIFIRVSYNKQTSIFSLSFYADSACLSSLPKAPVLIVKDSECKPYDKVGKGRRLHASSNYLRENSHVFPLSWPYRSFYFFFQHACLGRARLLCSRCLVWPCCVGHRVLLRLQETKGHIFYLSLPTSSTIYNLYQ